METKIVVIDNFGSDVVAKARLAVKLGSFFIIFCSLFPLFVGLDRAQNTQKVLYYLPTKNQQKHLGSRAQKKQCARSRFVKKN